MIFALIEIEARIENDIEILCIDSLYKKKKMIAG